MATYHREFYAAYTNNQVHSLVNATSELISGIMPTLSPKSVLWDVYALSIQDQKGMPGTKLAQKMGAHIYYV